MGGIMLIADRAHDEADVGPREKPRHGSEARQRQIDQRVVTEQHRAQHRQIGQSWDEQMRQGRRGDADIAGADQRAEPASEDRQGEPRRRLVGLQGQGQQREHRR